jgi:5-methyltetrahydropteroyltriglutamate--homocysteine methyltransferase
LSAEWVAFDEPYLVMDLTPDDIVLFSLLYRKILSAKGNTKVLLQTYFGDIRDCYREVISLPFDGVGLDFVEGWETQSLIKQHGFPADKILFAGVVNGKNVWRNNYDKTIHLLSGLKANIVLGTSCSLLHVPYTVKNDKALSEDHKKHFAFAEEKLTELSELKIILSSNHPEDVDTYIENRRLFNTSRNCSNPSVQNAVESLVTDDFIRRPTFLQRE